MFGRKRKLDDFSAEIQAHLRLETERLRGQGHSYEEARAAAYRAFGNVTKAQERFYESGRWLWWDHLWQDLRFALRMLRKSPGFTTVAILTLALGIGANTAMFSVIDTLMLRSLPFHRPNRLALLETALIQDSFPPHDTAKQFHEWAEHSSYLADAAVFEDGDVNLGGARALIRAHAAETSWNFFSLLGTRPILGRGFVSSEEVDAPGWEPHGPDAVAVIGYALWQQFFGGDPRALGATIRVDGNLLRIIAIAPPGFDYPNHCVLWKPAAFSRGNNGWATIGRLKQGISWAQARAAFAVEVSPLLPKPAQVVNQDVLPLLLSLQDGLLGPVKNATLLLMGAVLLVWLITCTNLANLLIARSADRRTELSIRAALGAGRARLARQWLTECLLLSLVAGSAAVLAAYWTVPLAATVEPPPLGVQSYSILNGHVLAFALTVSGIAAVLLGLLSLLNMSNFQTLDPRGSKASRGSRVIHETLVVAQVMLTTVLLSASVLVGHALTHLMSTDRGYDVTGIATVSVSLDGTAYQSGNRQLPYFEQLLDRIRRLPGVRSASVTEFLPLSASGFIGGRLGIDGHPAKRNSIIVPVFSDYFRTMRGRILYGREFNDAEVRSGSKVAVVNEPFADTFGSPSAAIGRQLTADGESSWKIVGVVKGMDYETDPTLVNPFQAFIPPMHPGIFPPATFVARVDSAAESHLAAIHDIIRSADPEVPIFGAKTMQQRLDELFAHPRFYRTAVWTFTGFALLLIVIGTYGVLAYTVARRTNEIGIRMALGAKRSNVARMVLGEAFLMVCVGIVGGVPLVFWIKRLAGTLMGNAPGTLTAPITFGALSILAIALVAAYIPARRAMRVDPVAALRHE
jgi:predicted permease